MDYLSRQDRVATLQQVIDLVTEHPFAVALVVICVVCAFTRVLSAVRFHSTLSQPQSQPGPRTVPVLPYWIPWLGQGVSFALGGTGYLTRKARALGPQGSVYALWMANSKHNVITMPSLARQILVDRHAPIAMEAMIYHVMRTFWDDRGSIKAIEPGHLWGNIHHVLNGMLRESFVAKAIQGTVDGVERRTWNLVSGAESVVDQSIWEREANIQVISDGDGDCPLVVEASFFPLVRHFVADLASTVLMGRNFMENNPHAVQDLFEMDSRFNLFVAGTPRWFPGMGAPSAARERLLRGVQEHHDALYKYLDGEDPGTKWGDMSDVSSVIVDRATAFREANSSPRAYATGNGAILWAMNVNANPVIFWMLWYLYADRQLLEEVRREIGPFVKLNKSSDDGLPVKEAPRLQIDMASLWAKCPLLRGAFYETMRLEAASMSYKMVDQDFVVTESEEDARIAGKTPQSFLLRKGEYICIPHGVHQSDERYFRDPDRFDPRRFWVVDDDDPKVDGQVKVDYGTMRVWGGGKQMCKGKTFAEREVVLFVAAIVMQWDVVPVGDGGKWVHPGRQVGAGAATPKKDVKVRLSRREDW